ncbi:MAG: hypothetical protein LBG58_05805, partial [Planctomycetaceae bacterium]|nr:hypothetical protein [Planctomycetaceae bacterium]
QTIKNFQTVIEYTYPIKYRPCGTLCCVCLIRMLKHTVNKVFYLIVLAGLIKIKIDSYVSPTVAYLMSIS